MDVSTWIAGMKPESVDNEFENLDGIYKAKVQGLTINEPNEYVENPHYKLILEVLEVLDGNGSPGRTLRRNYDKTSEEAVKKLVNDLHTAGIELDRSSEAAFEQSFQFAVGMPVYLRAWSFTPKDAPEKKIQVWAVKEAKNVEKLVAKAEKSEIPF